MRFAALFLGIAGGGLGALLSVSSLADEFTQTTDLAAAYSPNRRDRSGRAP